ncbi:MAG: NUDIX hydrolase [Planctomycetota bacterium]|nr:NUDIX hydrolase [Planctomycetota bacterium]
MSSPSPRPWPIFSSEKPETLHLFQPRWDTVENPRTGARMRRLVLETPNWVNVVARMESGGYLMVLQYRFGSAQVTAEIPGGVIDPGEDPLAAARRELREETGCEATRWVDLGSVEPNPAFHDNRCHHFLADGARRVGDLELDPGEDIVVEEWSEERLVSAVLEGEVDHALVLSALSRVLDLRRDLDGAGA